MRIFVSGATGVVGVRVVPLLLSRGHSVTAVTRNPEARAHLERAGARPVAVDLFDVNAVRKAVARHDVIINLATHIPPSAARMILRRSWRENDRLRTEGVANIVDAALAAGAPRLIQESFAPIYADRGDEWVDESAPLQPTAYNRTTVDAEQSVARFTSRGGTGVALRFAGFYGPDAIQVQSYIDALRKGWAALPGSPQKFISSIAHDDAATAVVAALEVPAGAYNVGDDEPVRRAVFFGSLAEALGLKAPRFLPDWTVSLLGSVGETMGRSLRMSNRKLRGATQWQPQFRSVREGWPVMLAQMKEHRASA